MPNLLKLTKRTCRNGGYGVSTQREVVPQEGEAAKLTCFVTL